MRETGPVRKGVLDDGSAPYLSFARTLLGQLKHHMRAGGLAQSSRSVVLADGTQITVASRHGQDSLNIVVPPAIVAARRQFASVLHVPMYTPIYPEVPAPPPLTQHPLFVLCGECDTGVSPDGLTPMAGNAVLWSGNHPINMGLPPGASQATACGISQDGKTIGGAAFTGTNSTSPAFIWTRAGGFTTLAPVTGTTQNTSNVVSGMSSDGKTLSMWAGPDDSGNFSAWVWTPGALHGGGLFTGPGSDHQQLAGPSGMPQAVALGVSPDGKTIVGCGWDFSANNANTTALSWDASSLAATTLDTGGYDATYAWATSRDGSVIVGSAQMQSDNTSTACYWKNGSLVPLPLLAGMSNGLATAATPDGNTILGMMGSGGQWQVTEGEGYGMSFWSGQPGSVRYWSSTQHAFVWNARGGTHDLGVGGIWSVTADGRFACGHRNGVPTVWDLQGSPTALALMAGANFGFGAAIASTQFTGG